MRLGSILMVSGVLPRCCCAASASRIAWLGFWGSNVFPFCVTGGWFRLGRNYTLAVTETVGRLELLRLTPREYRVDDKNVKRLFDLMIRAPPRKKSLRV